MGYKKATDILPEELLIQIQDYIDGECIYIPRKEENKKTWGELTKSKKETYKRNLDIYNSYIKGTSVKQLSETYYLSPKWIRKKVAAVRKEQQCTLV